MRLEKTVKECETCGHKTYKTMYKCDVCKKEVIEPIMVSYSMMSESDKHAIVENEYEVCSIACLIAELKEWKDNDLLLSMTIRNIDREHFKEVNKDE